MTGSEPKGRAADMARSLRKALVGRGASEEDEAAVGRAYALGMKARIETLTDDHHPAYLHPGRNALLLIQDVEGVDPIVLVIAALHESLDEALRATAGEVEAEIGAGAMNALRTIPLPGDERLVERLLALGPGLSLAALAERLDHLRHLHLREDLIDVWADTHTEVSEAWLPFAARTHPVLTRRYAHWVRTFAKRI